MKRFIFVLVTISPFIFVYLFTLKGIRDLNAKKNIQIESLREKENRLETKRVEFQKLTSEDEIVAKAKTKFDLERIDHISRISINKNKIKNIKQFIAKKYD